MLNVSNNLIKMETTFEREVRTIQVNLKCPTCDSVCQNRVRHVKYYQEYYNYECLQCNKTLTSRTKYPYLRYEPIIK